MDSLDAIAQALDRLSQAEQELHDSVRRARSQGRTWQEVADVLGVTRQAAFKRFGHPTDPETGDALETVPPVDLPSLTREAAADLGAGDFGRLRSRMTQACSRQLTARVVSSVWSDILGSYGDPVAIGSVGCHGPAGERLPEGPVRAPAVGRAELVHEHGELVLKVQVNRNGRITGLVIRPSSAPETWPL
ncbi:hypothetical protein GCM10027030_14020 [Luteococcus sediminum]